MSLTNVALVLVWIVVLGLAILVALLYRQFGLLYVGSGGRVRMSGLAIGDHAPSGLPLEVGNVTAPLIWKDLASTAALVFGAPACPLCATVIDQLNDVSAAWRGVAQVIFIDRKAPGMEMPKRVLPSQRLWTYGISPDGELHNAFDAQVNPFAFIVDSDGRVLARDIVNSGDDLDQLLQQALHGGQIESTAEATAIS